MSPRRPPYFLIEPIALAVAMMAGVVLLMHSFTKRAASGSGVSLERSGSGNDVLRTRWPLIPAGIGGPVIVSVVVAAPGLAAAVFPVAVFAVLALGVASSVRRSVLRR